MSNYDWIKNVLEDAIKLRSTLEWAMDLMDMYDKRLAAIDNPDLVYSDVHIKAKAEARELLRATISYSGTEPPDQEASR